MMNRTTSFTIACIPLAIQGVNTKKYWMYVVMFFFSSPHDPAFEHEVQLRKYESIGFLSGVN